MNKVGDVIRWLRGRRYWGVRTVLEALYYAALGVFGPCLSGGLVGLVPVASAACVCRPVVRGVEGSRPRLLRFPKKDHEELNDRNNDWKRGIPGRKGRPLATH